MGMCTQGDPQTEIYKELDEMHFKQIKILFKI